MKKIIVNGLGNSPKLTEGVLWNLIDHFEAPEEWWHWLIKYETARVRPLVVQQALQELGLIRTLLTVAECYRFQIA